MEHNQKVILQVQDKSTLIIGAGFYGLSIALYLHDQLKVNNIVILEKEHETMTRASYVNQARVHNGYHYPRSVLTGYRSAVNFPRFVEQFKPAVVSNFDKYYVIARYLSKVNATQFKHFCEKIGADVTLAEEHIKKKFNSNLVEEIFKVKEYAFDSRILRNELLKQIDNRPSIKLITNARVEEIGQNHKEGLYVKSTKGTYFAHHVINCTYANINTLHRTSNLPLVDLKHEVTEICLVRLPEELRGMSVTLMDGPFFSIMPFPSKNLYSLSHVRYTPHESWRDDSNLGPDKHDAHGYLEQRIFKSNYQQMYNDVVRFMPSLKGMKYAESIVDVKTVLMKSESDDSRPILFKVHHGIKNYVCVMGGKLDNIYDVYEELDRLYEKKDR